MKKRDVPRPNLILEPIDDHEAEVRAWVLLIREGERLLAQEAASVDDDPE